MSTRSPTEARQQAENALAARLPCQFGPDTVTKLSPATWVRLYTELADMSKRRDGAVSMHQLGFNDTGRRRRGLRIKEVERSLNTSINEVSSERMIRLPACGGSPGTAGRPTPQAAPPREGEGGGSR
jgi:hypothetical protein